MIDYLEGGIVGGIYGEGLQGVRADNSRARDWRNTGRKGNGIISAPASKARSPTSRSGSMANRSSIGRIPPTVPRMAPPQA
jgi:hypothetical protein